MSRLSTKNYKPRATGSLRHLMLKVLARHTITAPYRLNYSSFGQVIDKYRKQSQQAPKGAANRYLKGSHQAPKRAANRHLKGSQQAPKRQPT